MMGTQKITKIINGRVLDVFDQELVEEDVWVQGDKVLFVGATNELRADDVVDAKGLIVSPGLIDGHVHVESSSLAPTTFATVLMQRGVTRAYIDPHEIASVAGVEALRYMITESRRTPFHFEILLPSSVPATSFEHAGATLHAADLKPFYKQPEVVGLAEVMDYPAVATKNPDMMQKINDALAAHRFVDGHGAGFTPEQLAVFRAAGIDSDHEATNAVEAMERLAAGMYVFIREGTVEKDELAILPVVTPENQHRFSFVTDDKTIVDLLDEGSIDHNVRVAIEYGMPLTRALTMATLNGALSHENKTAGAIAPGYDADIVFFDDKINAQRVMVAGQWIDRTEELKPSQLMLNPMNVSLTAEQLNLPLISNRAHVIGVKPFHVDTEHLIETVPVKRGEFIPDETYAKITVAERYHDLGNAVGIIKGLGLKYGAIGTTFSNDSHNLVIAGVSDAAMLKAAEVLKEHHGGMVVVDNQLNVTLVPLAIGGVMSDESVADVAADFHLLQEALQKQTTVDFDVFQTLSFMALPVIPSLKITDQGLFDFDKFDFIDINA